MLTLLVAVVVLNSLILLAVIIAAWVVITRTAKATDAAEKALMAVGDNLPGVLKAAEGALKSIEFTSDRVGSEMDRVDSVLRSTERIVSGVAVAEVALRTVKGGSVTAGRVIAGALEVLRALKTPKDKTKEGSDND